MPKIKIEIVLSDNLLESVAAAVTQAAKIGDGKLFILDVERAVRIRTEAGNKAAIQLGLTLNSARRVGGSADWAWVFAFEPLADMR